jgi:hypothetical protein
MKTMRHDAPTELTIHARELRELFSEREFDPLVDHGDVLSSIAQIALPLAVETLVIAGWVIMWQPMDTLILGRLPIRQQERTYRTIASMPAIIEAAHE